MATEFWVSSREEVDSQVLVSHLWGVFKNSLIAWGFVLNGLSQGQLSESLISKGVVAIIQRQGGQPAANRSNLFDK